MKTSTIKLTTLLTFGVGVLGISNAQQFKFSDASSVLHSQTGTLGSNAGVHSGNAVIVVDIDNNGLDDIAKLDENRYLRIEYQQGGGTFSIANSVFDIGAGNDDIWGGSMADVDHNGYKDYLYAGWGAGARLVKLNGTGTGNLGITTLPNGNIASQNCNFMDVNNDGWEDIFVCNDVNESKLWVNSGSGTFPAEQGNAPHINFNVTPGVSAPNDESGNYGSVWTDFDNDGDVDFYIIHCRQGQPSGDLRRTNVLFENNGSNVFTSNAAAHGLASNNQDWTGSFGDIDNDGDFDLVMTGHEAGNTNRIYENDGSGNFTQIGTLFYNGNAYESHMEDFDNDGWIDVMMTGSSAGHVFHRNNGDGTFTQISNGTLGILTSNDLLSAAVGDLNHDGKVDLYASFGDGYNSPDASQDDILYLNTVDNNNNFLTLDLRGTTSTDGALGARAYIYGAWGVQTREVRASESYGNMNTFNLHFGLGTETSVDSVVVDWPAVGSPNTTITNPTINQFITIVEGTCVSPVNTITYAGSPVICTPGYLTLNAPTGAGYSYLWSTGETTPSINVSTPGNYNVRVSEAGNACISWSPSIAVTVNPDETPTITAAGATTVCDGESVTLTSSEASGNTWSNSSTSQSINVTTSGTYSLVYAGACQNWNSNSISVTVLAAPSPTTTTNDNLVAPGSGTLTSTGTTVRWFDAVTGGTIVGTGSPFTTPVVSTTTTYYAEDALSYGGGVTGNVGQVNHAGTNFNGLTYNGYLVFDVIENATLNSVKVYADVAGDRTIELRNSVGTVLNSAVVNIPAGITVITLGFPMTPGTNYELGTNDAANEAAFGAGNVSPQLRRSTTGVAYPYTLAGGAVSITSSSAPANYYYFFDWNITTDPTNICGSVRTPATVFVNYAGIEDNADLNLHVYPNPTSDFVQVEFTSPEVGEATLAVYDMLGKKVLDLNLGTVNGTIIKTINTSTFAKGIYNIKLTINNSDYNTKVVVK